MRAYLKRNRGLVRMKVLFFRAPKMGHGFGGVTNVAYNLPMALAKKVLITYYPTYSPPVVSRRKFATNVLNSYMRLVIKDFDFIHFCYGPGWKTGWYLLFKLAKINRISTILHIHGIIQMEHILYDLPMHRFWGTSYKGLSNTLWNCKLADKIVTYSEFMRNEIAIWYGINREKIVVIPNGVNVRKFSRCSNELRLDGDPAILYIGNLARFKSPDIIIQAIAKIRLDLPKLKLHLVGPGNNIALKNLARKKGVETRVIFHGRVKPEKAPLYYKAADFCIFPSKRDNGTITLLEAMASGTPIIASERGGTAEIISHTKNGILFDPDDVDALSNAILVMQKDSKLRKIIVRNAMKTVTNYSWESIAKRYVSLYKSLRQV